MTEAAELYRAGSRRCRQEGWEIFKMIVADTLKDANLEPTMSVREARKIVEKVATAEDATARLEDFIESYTFTVQETQRTVSETAPTSAHSTTTNRIGANIRTLYKQLNPDEYARQRKVLRGDVEEAWKEKNHFKLLRKIDRYIDWPAAEFHEALQACGHEALLPSEDATPAQYLQRLATTDELYSRHMVESQVSRYRSGRATGDPRAARLMLALARELVKYTLPQDDDPERISKLTLARRMGLGSLWDYGTFFVSADRIWARTQRAFTEATSREDFHSACREAEDAIQNLWASQCHGKPTTTAAAAHHIADTPEPAAKAHSSLKERLRRYPDLTLAERRTLREKQLPPTLEGQCHFCGRHGHVEKDCHARRELSALYRCPN